MIRFADPALLGLLALLPLLYLWLGRRGGRATLRYPSVDVARGAARMARSRFGRLLPVARLLALAGVIVALARPEIVRARTEAEASGVDIVLAVDVSSSMNALDLEEGGEPRSRLDVVKPVVRDFIEKRPNDRIGLVAFSGGPYLVSPPTLDHDWLLQNLSRLRTGMVEDGTAIGSALASSVDRLRDEPGKSKIVVLLTDGVNNAGRVPPELAAEAARTFGTKVYTVGVGTRGEAPMPVEGPDGRTRLVMTEVDVDEETLTKIADATGGAYFRATDEDSLREVYAAIDAMEKTTRKMARFETREPRFQLAAWPAAAVLLLELALRLTRLRRVP